MTHLFASINVVSKEEVVGFRRETAIFEESEKIVVLSVDVTYRKRRMGTDKWTNNRSELTADLDRRFKLEKNRLVDEDVTSLGAEIPDFVL